MRVNRPLLNALDVHVEFSASTDEVKLQLVPGGTIGAVPLRAPNTEQIAGGVVVLPRFGWDGMGQMLHQIGWAASPQILASPLVPGSAREVPSWVLAGPILRRIADLLREVRRGFYMREEIRQAPRGQILWQRYCLEQLPRGQFHQLPCRFPDLEVDRVLRGFLRWGLERVHSTLMPHITVDMLARRLSEEAHGLLTTVRDIPARVPDRKTMSILMQGTTLPSQALLHGLEALGWIVDERGLAGLSELDGLSWAMPMHELFERWVEHLVRRWAYRIGGEVASGRKSETVFPIQWSRPSSGSLSSLVPDIVVRVGDRVAIFDAKYKGHFEELDETRWVQLRNELQSEHRHDVHQVLAYASLFEAQEITAALVYPMSLPLWRRLASEGRVAQTATLTSAGRQLRLDLLGVPVQLDQTLTPDSVVESWGTLSSR